MELRYSSRNRRHAGLGFSSGSALGPLVRNRCRAVATGSPVSGSTSNAVATASAGRAYQAA